MRVSQFFEIQVADGCVDEYLELAASLKPLLDAMGGCLSIERFRSLSQPDLLLSYQIWRDEGSLAAWRAHARHHAVQNVGRRRIFANYRIRIAQVIHEERPVGEPWTPQRLTTYNDPARRPPTFAVVSESERKTLPIRTRWPSKSFASLYRTGRHAHLTEVPSPEEGVALGRALFADPTTEYFRVCEVFRDYGMFDRREAPQYYPPLERERPGDAITRSACPPAPGK